MRHWVLGSICAGLVAAAWGCSSGAGSSGGATGDGGAATADGGDGAGPDTAGAAGGADGGAPSACSLVANGLQVSKGRGTTPSVVWTGQGYVVVWRDLDADEGDIHLAALDANGDKQREAVIEDGPGTSSHPSVHRDGDGLLVLWQDSYGAGSIVRGRRTTLSGIPRDNAFTVAPSTAPESWPSGAAGPSGSIAAWTDSTRAMLGFIGGSALSTAIPIDRAQFPAVATEGGETALVWARDSAIGFARPRQGSTSLDATSHEGVNAKLLRVALAGHDAFVAWEDLRDGSEQVRMARVSEQGEFSREAVVSQGEGSANWPALAWTGRRMAVAYYQFRDGPPSVFVALMSRELEPAGPNIEVSGRAPARFPAVAWTGEELGVAYAENDRGIRLSRAACR
jgi:hypothetical protein